MTHPQRRLVELKRAREAFRRELRRIDFEIIMVAWESTENIPCTCGGYEDSLHSRYHSRYCNRRLAAEEAETYDTRGDR